MGSGASTSGATSPRPSAARLKSKILLHVRQQKYKQNSNNERRRPNTLPPNTQKTSEIQPTFHPRLSPHALSSYSSSSSPPMRSPKYSPSSSRRTRPKPLTPLPMISLVDPQHNKLQLSREHVRLLRHERWSRKRETMNNVSSKT